MEKTCQKNIALAMKFKLGRKWGNSYKPYGSSKNVEKLKKKNFHRVNDEWEVGKCYSIPFMVYWMNDNCKSVTEHKLFTNEWIIVNISVAASDKNGLY